MKIAVTLVAFIVAVAAPGASAAREYGYSWKESGALGKFLNFGWLEDVKLKTVSSVEKTPEPDPETSSNSNGLIAKLFSKRQGALQSDSKDDSENEPDATDINVKMEIGFNRTLPFDLNKILFGYVDISRIPEHVKNLWKSYDHNGVRGMMRYSLASVAESELAESTGRSTVTEVALERKGVIGRPLRNSALSAFFGATSKTVKVSAHQRKN